MTTFVYRAKQGPERTVEGILEADSRTDAAERLDARGLTPVEIREQAARTPRARVFSFIRRPVAHRDVVVFTYQLASLLQAGVPMLRALRTVGEQIDSPPFLEVVRAIERRVCDGNMLSEALAAFPAVFSELYVNLVRAGESGGVLDRILAELAEAMDSGDDLRRRVRAALAYPLLTVTMGLVTVFVLLSFFMPRVVALFDHYESLPRATRLLVGISAFFEREWYWMVLAAFLVAALYRRVKTRERGRLALDALRLRLPLLGGLLRLTDVARFARTLALLLTAGLPIERALTLAMATMKNRALQAEVDRVRLQTVHQGMPFSEGLRHAAYFPPYVANMCAVGEEGGRLDATLLEVARFYERQIERNCRTAVSLLEPILILVVGALVGFIVAAMLLPIFELSTRL